MWEHKYYFLPTRKPFLTLKLTTSLDYMDWFKHNSKSYLLSTSKKSRQCRRRSPRQVPINPRSRDGDVARLTFAPSTSKESTVVQPLDQCAMPYYMSIPPMTPKHSISPSIPTFYLQPGHAIPYSGPSIVLQTPLASLFYRGDEVKDQPRRTRQGEAEVDEQ
ncbi:hypothetical protein Golob_001052, partial [Gossypium lobatum]|nr:hypothetical protein [Gossypium lobatum]